MTDDQQLRVAIVYPGDQETRQRATLENNRLAPIFQALARRGVHAEPTVYHDRFGDDVHRQLMGVDGVLVWMNPIQDGRNRTLLDAMLRDVADAGIFVSTHPDIILKMGTKQVLYDTRGMPWGCDTHVYADEAQLRQQLPARLASSEARVLKQYRGNGGNGVWKVELATATGPPRPDTAVRVRHARRGSIEATMSLDDFFTRCRPYFSNGGKIIDQAYQTRLPEGMVRCYLVQERVVGFGHQAVNALYPAPAGRPPEEAPPPGPRLYHPPDMSAFQTLKQLVEQQWVGQMQRLLGIENYRLPILWDCDFLLGPRQASGEDSYVLCEINVSSVAPFPDSAPPFVAESTIARVIEARKKRRHERSQQ